MVEASWSGKYPCYCSGQWTLKVDGKDVSDKIPESLRGHSMNTYGSYESWRFTGGWDVVWDRYSDGLTCWDWINENKYWLKEISDNEDVWVCIYNEINSHDFRNGQCGGCI